MIFNFFFLFFFSIIANYFILMFAKLGLFGKQFSKITKKILIKQPILFYVIYFFIILFLLFLIESQIIYCKDITKNIDNLEVTMTGDIFNLIVNTIGATTVFIGGTRIAAAIVSTHKLSFIPKAGIIGSTGFIFTILFHSANKLLDGYANTQVNSINIKLSGVNPIAITSPVSSKTTYFKLSDYLGVKGISFNTTLNISPHSMKVIQEQASAVLPSLDQANPNWKEYLIINPTFINSPLEPMNSSWINNIVDILTNYLYIQYSIFYLITMLIIIFTCKLFIDKNMNLEWVKGIIGGNYLYWGITKYLSFWRGSANFWIYYILICLWIFSGFEIYCLDFVITKITLYIKQT